MESFYDGQLLSMTLYTLDINARETKQNQVQKLKFQCCYCVVKPKMYERQQCLYFHL